MLVQKVAKQKNILPVITILAVFCTLGLVYLTANSTQPPSHAQVASYLKLKKSSFLNCQEFVSGNKKSIRKYVNNGREKIDPAVISRTAMDCDSIRFRVHGSIEAPKYPPLERRIAFLRNVYEVYELQEAFLSISYHPSNTFCFALDSKSSKTLKSKLRKMQSCFPNVHVLDEEYNFDSKGHRQDRAHIDCLRNISGKEWDHAILLQSSDLIIKTPSQISAISQKLNTTSAMGFDLGFRDRYNTSADWTPSGLKLFQNGEFYSFLEYLMFEISETSISPDILNRPLIIRKFANHVILSRIFVNSIFEHLNLDRLLDLLDDETKYGVDEMLFQTLYGNYLGLDGQMESNCSNYHNDNLTKVVFWDFSGSEGYDKDCKSGFKRHALCILGVEYLQDLAKNPAILANKVMASFDFGTVLCMREMVRNGTTAEIMSEKQMMVFPQFREMYLKNNGTYDSGTFDC